MRQELDNAIISRLRKGETSCFEEIIANYRDYCVGGLIKKIRCTEEEAQDLFIEGLLEFREMVILGKIDKVINLKSYLFGICYNLWLTDQRENKKISSGASDVERYFYGYLYEDDLFDDESAYKINLIAIARKAISILSDKCRKIITYYYLENMNMVEIAKEMNFASSDVSKTSKSRCFQKLLDEVQELKKTMLK
jgi:RNA polymerase sigma factor (sigma-70 family)